MFSISQNEYSSTTATPQNNLKGSNPVTREGDALGLVFTSTSDTHQTTYRLNPKDLRLKRLKRSVLTATRLLVEELEAEKARYQSYFVTLTYSPGKMWHQLHISKALKCVRSWCDRQGIKFRYVWVAEIQTKRQLKEGGHCVHYHLLIFLPMGYQLPKFDKRGWWPHGMTQTAKAHKPIGYMVKYASKGGDAGYFPKGCRLSGSGGLTHDSRWQKAWWMVPAYVRAWWPNYIDRPQRAKGGGWLSKITGDWNPSKFKIINFNPLVITEVTS